MIWCRRRGPHQPGEEGRHRRRRAAVLVHLELRAPGPSRGRCATPRARRSPARWSTGRDVGGPFTAGVPPRCAPTPRALPHPGPRAREGAAFDGRKPGLWLCGQVVEIARARRRRWTSRSRIRGGWRARHRPPGGPLERAAEVRAFPRGGALGRATSASPRSNPAATTGWSSRPGATRSPPTTRRRTALHVQPHPPLEWRPARWPRGTWRSPEAGAAIAGKVLEPDGSPLPSRWWACHPRQAGSSSLPRRRIRPLRALAQRASAGTYAIHASTAAVPEASLGAPRHPGRGGDPAARRHRGGASPCRRAARELPRGGGAAGGGAAPVAAGAGPGIHRRRVRAPRCPGARAPRQGHGRGRAQRHRGDPGPLGGRAEVSSSWMRA